MIKEKANEINITVLRNLLENKDEKIALDNIIEKIEKKIIQSKYIKYTGEICDRNNVTLTEHFNCEGKNYKIVRNEELEKDINIKSYLEKSFKYILSVLPQNMSVMHAWLNPIFKENYFEILVEKL